MFDTFSWPDPGKVMEEKLRKMTKEELEDEVVESQEEARIYDKFHTCVMELVDTMKKGEIVFSKQWINRLGTPEIGAEFNPIQWELICSLKKELVQVAHALGFTEEAENVFYRPVEREAEKTHKMQVVKYGVQSIDAKS